MSIFIGADLVPTASNEELFIGGKADELLGEELFSLLKSGDYRIFNLETPLADQETPLDKSGRNLISKTACVKGYSAIGADLLTLSNNHILDQSEMGLVSTFSTLESNGIAHLGAGMTLSDAAKPFFFKAGEKNVGVYACTEHEYSIATESSSGANPFDPLESYDAVSDMKQECDYVIVLYHGGKEHYRYPSPELQRICRKFAQKGADLVVCQHSHCIGCEEKYKDSTIVYGQGNFLFDLTDKEPWQTGLLIQLDRDFNLSYIPLVKTGNKVRLADNDKAREIMDSFNKRSEEIKDPKLVQEKYSEFARNSLVGYFNVLSGGKKYGLFTRVMNKLSGGKYVPKMYMKRYSRDMRFVIKDIVQCEAHRELLIEALRLSNEK